LILPVSNIAKVELLKKYDIPESRIRVIHPGVSFEPFESIDKDKCRIEIRARYGLNPEDIVVLFVGMNFEIKGLELLLRGIASVVSEESNEQHGLKLLVVGKGDQKRYSVMAEKLGIGDRVVFAGVTREVEKYYLASDIFAMPSVYDTFGLVVLEAMVAGLPVIISGNVGAKDLVDPGVNGFILSDESPLQDITKFLTLLVNRETRMEMGESCRQVARRQSWENLSGQIGAIYYHICKLRLKIK
jgi:UDP-glucose:(heptosyl)LPS alpha-1,3-glucosyltransferase